MNIKKIIYIVLGFLSLGCGALGTLLPILPTVPFLMLAAICFAKSSEKLHAWFRGTKIYKDNLESFVAGKGMTFRAKMRIMGMVTVLMSFGAFVMLQKGVYMPCVLLACVWICHVIYFTVGVKTVKM